MATQDLGTRRTLGVLLLILGIFSALVEFNIMDISAELILASLFFFSGFMLIVSFFTTHKSWRLVCGAFLIFIAIPIFNEVYEIIPDEMIGSIFLWLLGGSFLLIYMRDRGQWWSIIPAGIFISLGVLVAVESADLLDNDALGAILFFGLAVTFGYLYLIHDVRIRTAWALWPALFFLFIAGMILTMPTVEFLLESGIFFSLLLIAIGVFLVWRDLRTRKNSSGAL